jgi:hypothetical protein
MDLRVEEVSKSLLVLTIGEITRHGNREGNHLFLNSRPIVITLQAAVFLRKIVFVKYLNYLLWSFLYLPPQ